MSMVPSICSDFLARVAIDRRSWHALLALKAARRSPTRAPRGLHRVRRGREADDRRFQACPAAVATTGG